MLDYGRLSALLLGWCVFWCFGCGNGCAGDGQPQEPFVEIVPQERLPDGWRLPPTSEMPPNDKMPWWRQNPLLLKGPETKQLEFEGKPTSACKVWGAIYMKEDDAVLIVCLKYPTREAALAEYRLLQHGHSPDRGMVGFSRKQENAIVLVTHSPDCPDREFFVKHFEAVARNMGQSPSLDTPNR